MKKIILMLVLPIISWAQVCKTIDMHLIYTYSTIPYNNHLGDTSCNSGVNDCTGCVTFADSLFCVIEFRFNQNGPFSCPPSPTTFYTITIISDSAGSYYYTPMRTLSEQDLLQFPISSTSQGGWYKVYFKTPNSFPFPGGASLGYIQINSTSYIRTNYTPVCIYGNPQIGVDELKPQLNNSMEYFNLLGQPIKDPKGIAVEITTFSDGRKKARKIFIAE